MSIGSIPRRREADLVVGQVQRLSALLLIASAPNSRPWTGQAHVTTLTLNRLDHDEVQRWRGGSQAITRPCLPKR
jgi:hypothetical protein